MAMAHTTRWPIPHGSPLHDQSLQQTEMEKDLGVIIKDSLSSSGLVVEVRNKALRMFGAINRNVSYKSEEVIAKLYCTN